jgi:hypothetical protein
VAPLQLSVTHACDERACLSRVVLAGAVSIAMKLGFLSPGCAFPRGTAQAIFVIPAQQTFKAFGARPGYTFRNSMR